MDVKPQYIEHMMVSTRLGEGVMRYLSLISFSDVAPRTPLGRTPHGDSGISTVFLQNSIRIASFHPLFLKSDQLYRPLTRTIST